MKHTSEELERIANLAARDAESPPDFREVLGRVRARARGVRYDPDIHHPKVANRAYEERVSPDAEARLKEIRERFNERGRQRGRTAPAELRPLRLL